MNEPSGAASAAPFFVPIAPAAHGRLRLKSRANYLSARAANAIPITISELAEASADYPVVFNKDTPRQLIAVVGLEADRNLFVDSDGEWSREHYIPAALRRRPLALAKASGENEFAVMINAADRETLSESEGDLIFENGQFGKRAQELVEFCRELQAASEETQRFIEAVEKQGLLIERRVDFTGRNGAAAQVGGWWMIDRVRLRDLPDAVVLEWHRRGWLAWASFHLGSEGRWARLVGRVRSGVTASDTAR